MRLLVGAVVARHGRLDIMVNNAAIYSELPLVAPEDIDAALWDRVMAVNVRGSFLMVKHAIPHMKRTGYGKIINIGSGLAYKGAVGFAHYATSKGGVVAMTRALARDAYPEDLLGALVFLASADSDFMTGQSLAVDGGSVNL